jgi:hypothetical protein
LALSTADPSAVVLAPKMEKTSDENSAIESVATSADSMETRSARESAKYSALKLVDCSAPTWAVSTATESGVASVVL